MTTTSQTAIPANLSAGRARVGSWTVTPSKTLLRSAVDRVLRHFGGPAQVVLGLQSGVPFSSAGKLEQLATALGLAIAMRRFRRATILVGEDPGVSSACMNSCTVDRPDRYR